MTVEVVPYSWEDAKLHDVEYDSVEFCGDWALDSEGQFIQAPGVFAKGTAVWLGYEVMFECGAGSEPPHCEFSLVNSEYSIHEDEKARFFTIGDGVISQGRYDHRLLSAVRETIYDHVVGLLEEVEDAADAAARRAKDRILARELPGLEGEHGG